MHQPYYCLVFCLGLIQACQPVVNREQTIVAAPAIVDTVLRLSQSDSLFKLGKFYDSKNNKDSAVYYHAEALRLKEGLSADTSLFRNYVALGKLYINRHKFKLADDYFEKAKLLTDVNPTITSLDKVNLYMDLSYCKRELVNYGEARANLRIAQFIVQKEYAQDFNLKGRIDLTLGNIYFAENQYESAIRSYEQSIGHFKRVDRFNAVGLSLIHI